MSKTKSILLVAVIVVAVLLVVMVVTAPKPGGQKGANGKASPVVPTEPPAAPVIQSSERRFEVLALNGANTYQVRDLGDGKELGLFIPSDAAITAGDIKTIKVGTMLTVQKFLPAANGLVALELSVATAE